MSSTPQISLVVANWNGADFLTRCLSSIQHAVRHAGVAGELIVVDDASEDASCEIITERFPRARLLRNETNRGFIDTANRGVLAAQAPLVFLLNNDMSLKADYVAQCLAHFADSPDLFAVTAQTVAWHSQQPNHAWMAARLEHGSFRLFWEHPPTAREALFLQGGSCCLRREMFEQLGGFDAIFQPGYWEDYDLSLRAWSRGWRIVYEPAARAWHIGKASFQQKYGSSCVHRLNRRNRLLFEWLHGDGAGLFLKLPGRLARESWRGDMSGVRALLQAWPLRQQAARGRQLRRTERTRPLAEILQPFAANGTPE